MTRRGEVWHVWRLDVACGGDPEGAVLRALERLDAIRGGEIWSVGIAHDEDCPGAELASISACTCEIVQLEARRAA